MSMLSLSMPSFTRFTAARDSRPLRTPTASALTFALTLALGTVLSGCGQKTEEPGAKAEPAAMPAQATAVCQASQSWITNPNPPSEVAATESFCDFYQFSWQWFLGEVSPSPTAQGERVFETNRLHDPTVSSGQCSLPEMVGRAAAAKMLAMRADKPQDFEDTQADGNALYDQNGNILHYNIWYSRAECQASQKGFTEGTFEIKVSWMILPKPDPSYYTMQATLPGKQHAGDVGYGRVPHRQLDLETSRDDLDHVRAQEQRATVRRFYADASERLGIRRQRRSRMLDAESEPTRNSAEHCVRDVQFQYARSVPRHAASDQHREQHLSHVRQRQSARAPRSTVTTMPRTYWRSNSSTINWSVRRAC